METRTTEHGSKRYSFALGKQNPLEVIRIFERDNKLSIHFVNKYGMSDDRLKSRQQFILAVKNNKLYMYMTSGSTMCRALTLDRAEGITISIAKTIFTQSGDKKQLAMGSIMSIKKIIRDFLYSQIDWYPKVSVRKLRIIELITLGSSKIVADRYIHEGIISRPSGLSQNTLRHSNTLTELSRKVFGFSSPWAMRESIRLLDGKMPFAMLFKGILSVDNIKKVYDGLSGESQDMYSAMYWFMEIPKMRKFLKMFHSDTILNWYKPRKTSDPYRSMYSTDADRYLNDTIRLWDLIPEEVRELPAGENNLRRIHDFLSMTQRKTSQSDYKLKPKAKVLEIDGAEVNDMKIVVPKTNYELIEWGTHMSNCIGSYGSSNNTLLGIVKNGELTYCLEISGGRMWQFKAKFNNEAPEQDRAVIEDYLEEKEILKENRHEPVF